jgi:hypothetical protein
LGVGINDLEKKNSISKINGSRRGVY